MFTKTLNLKQRCDTSKQMEMYFRRRSPDALEQNKMLNEFHEFQRPCDQKLLVHVDLVLFLDTVSASRY